MSPQLDCPSCRCPMERTVLPRNYLGEVELDLCYGCHGIWFDDRESLQLAPPGIIELFRRIHEHRDAPTGSVVPPGVCPRCQAILVAGHDMVRWGRFSFHQCPSGHGRYITFSQFLMEKGFIRPLSTQERADLAARVGTVRCSGCGGPVDIRLDNTCPHCRAPVSVLDPEAVTKALKDYDAAGKRLAGGTPPASLGTVPIHRFPPPSPSLAAAGASDMADLVISGIGLVLEVLSG